MKTLVTMKQFWRNEEGGESVEWPLIVGLVTIGVIGLWTALQTDIGNILSRMSTELQGVLGG
ncbi:MAG: Flp family type IVb pilin [Pseudomonadota bacterium]|nr:Flp family type IVb pilin [Pseudomonadota bacterium]